jgi:hypothetical protein
MAAPFGQPGTSEVPSSLWGGTFRGAGVSCLVMRAVSRLVAVVLVLGQLQWLPATVLCERRHQAAPSHCDQRAPVAPVAPAVAAADAAGGPVCALMQGCAALAGTARLAEPAPFGVPASVAGIAYSAALTPLSRTSAPTPPPPEV